MIPMTHIGWPSEARRTRALRLIGLGGIAVVVGAVVWFWAVRHDPQTAVNLAGIFTMLLAVPPLAIGVWTWRRSPPGPTDLADAVHALAQSVSDQWHDEAIRRSLDDPAPIPVRWCLTQAGHLIDHHANLAPPAQTLSVSSDQIDTLAQSWRGMRRRRLVILGGPGTGKTTLAVQLVRELLATRDAHPGEPVPVLLSISGWNAVEQPDVRDWLADRVVRDHPALRASGMSPDIGHALVRGRHLLPVLDGLDELAGPAQVQTMIALRSLGDTDQLILTSRTAEFASAVASAHAPVNSAAVIEPEPLEASVSADYLARRLPEDPGPAWNRVLTHLRTCADPSNDPLAANLTTALGLWLVRTVYLVTGRDPAALIGPEGFRTAAALRAHLLDELVPAVLATRPVSTDPAELFLPRHHYDPGQTRAWLGHLALLLNDPPRPDGTPRTRDITWWDLARSTGTFAGMFRHRLALAVFVLTIGAAALGSLFCSALTSAVAHHLAKSAGIYIGDVVLVGVAGAAAVGLASGLALLVTARSWPNDPPGYADLHLRRRGSGSSHSVARAGSIAFGRGFIFGYLAGALLAACLVFLAIFHGGAGNALFPRVTIAALGALASATLLAVPVALWCGLAASLVARAEVPTSWERSLTPITSWRADRSLNLLRAGAFALALGLTPGLALGIGAGFAIASISGTTAGVVAGAAYAGLVVLGMGLPLGTAGAMAVGRHRAWMAYAICVRRLSRTGRLPRHLMPFLDDAHRLGLLRAVGPVYQFRHAEFQDYLAAAYSTGPAAGAVPPAQPSHNPLAPASGRR
jgi:hypothetical protein